MASATSHSDLVADLLEKGVRLTNPASIEFGDDVNAAQISGDGVTIHGGCRIRGAKTVISAGCTLGAEGPVTIEDSQLGPGVDLKGGYFSKSVFLAGANMGLGAHVREGTILEEQANGAHCVGLKQTILFPFVTLGSLINFCDALMAGGTSRSDHSEVGSSYIHFNFTPDGNKTTASLFGDVPRGVMLDQQPIFLGGQGGAVGPIHTGFGTVVAAGSVLRGDSDADGMLVIPEPPQAHVRPLTPHTYRQLPRIMIRNLNYVASLDALEAWYRAVRQPFFADQELGEQVYAGALAALASGRRERLKRLEVLVSHLDSSPGHDELRAKAREIFEIFGSVESAVPSALDAELTASREAGSEYLAAIKALTPEARKAGVEWLQDEVDQRVRRAAELVPALGLPAN